MDEKLIIEVFEGTQISHRIDQFWNATQMCKVGGKRINNFLRMSSTKEYIDVVAKDLNVSPESLVEIKQGGNVLEQGTWVHEDIAIELAGWINPKFRLWVNRVAKKLIRDKVVYLENEIEALQAALSDSEGMVEVRERHIEELAAEAKYWEEEYNLYRHGSHPDYDEQGQFKGGIY